jgi:hypothetical protein
VIAGGYWYNVILISPTQYWAFKNTNGGGTTYSSMAWILGGGSYVGALFVGGITISGDGGPPRIFNINGYEYSCT